MRALLACAVLLSSAAAQAATHQATIEGMAFAPAQIEMKAGDTVVWTNRDLVPHTVTDRDGRFDSGLLAPGQSWQTTVKAPGRYELRCRLHPTMNAVLEVQRADH